MSYWSSVMFIAYQQCCSARLGTARLHAERGSCASVRRTGWRVSPRGEWPARRTALAENVCINATMAPAQIAEANE